MRHPGEWTPSFNHEHASNAVVVVGQMRATEMSSASPSVVVAPQTNGDNASESDDLVSIGSACNDDDDEFPPFVPPLPALAIRSSAPSSCIVTSVFDNLFPDRPHTGREKRRVSLQEMLKGRL